jgi:hypothetical protein
MKTLFKFFIILVVLVYISSVNHAEDTMEALKNYPNQVKSGGKAPKFLYFKMKDNLSYSIDYYSKIFYAYLNTMGVRAYFVNLKDKRLLALVPVDAEVDLPALKDNFSDLVDDIYLKLKME